MRYHYLHKAFLCSLTLLFLLTTITVETVMIRATAMTPHTVVMVETIVAVSSLLTEPEVSSTESRYGHYKCKESQSHLKKI